MKHTTEFSNRFRNPILLRSSAFALGLCVAFSALADTTTLTVSSASKGTSNIPVTLNFPVTRSGDIGYDTVLSYHTVDGSALAGTTWYFQFFFYTMGETQMGRYKFSSWTLHMASIMIFSTLWGIALKEWKGAGTRTKCLVGLSLLVLVASTMVVGYGNYLGAARFHVTEVPAIFHAE